MLLKQAVIAMFTQYSLSFDGYQFPGIIEAARLFLSLIPIVLVPVVFGWRMLKIWAKRKPLIKGLFAPEPGMDPKKEEGDDIMLVEGTYGVK